MIQPSTQQSAARQRIETALQEILESDVLERRADPRLPYFGPVMIAVSGGTRAVSAFCRDLSAGGIGLVHLQPLERGPVTIDLPLPSGQIATLKGEILWCRDFGNGWYSSGGRILDAIE
jgi:hypothetical protein